MSPRRKKKRIGIGATCSVLKRFLHPSKTIQQKYNNIASFDHLEGLIVLRREEKRIRNNTQEVAIVFRHADFEGIEVYCAERYAMVTEEGSPSDFFGQYQRNDDLDGGATESNGGAVDEPLEVPTLSADSPVEGNVSRLCAEGYGVDDNNEPAPDNDPAQQVPGNNNTSDKDWGSETVCYRMSKGHHFENARMNQHPSDGTRLSWYLTFLPVKFMQEVILVESNKNIEGKQVKWPEFLRFLGLIFLMSTVIMGYDCRSWFEDSEPNPSSGAPFRLQKYMARHRFENILSALRYTNKPFPQFQDKFHQVRGLIDAWNDLGGQCIHRSEVF